MISLRPEMRATQHRYYDVSITKFILLWLGTLGFYHFYWFYKQWRYEEDNGLNVSPFWRAVFAPFFVYALFDRVHATCDLEDTSNNWNPGILAALYIVGILSFKLAGHVFWSVGYLTFLPIVPVQLSINELNRRVAPDVPANNRIKPIYFIPLALGLIIFGLGVLARLAWQLLSS